MIRIWKVFRAVVSVLLILAVLLPAGLYVLLSLEPVRNAVRQTTATQLSTLLGADVSVKSVSIHPFRRVTVGDITMTIDGDTVAGISTVSAGIELLPLITEQQIVIDYALVDGLNLKVTRPEPGAPLNIAPVIERLKGGDKREKKKFNLEINTAIVRRASATYDVLSAPEADSAHFCPDHISVSNLAINAFIPEITDEASRVNLDHLSFNERSGFSLDKLTAKIEFAQDNMSVSDLGITMPGTQIALDITGHTSPDKIAKSLRDNTIRLHTAGKGTIYPPDLAAFIPDLKNIDRHISIDFDASTAQGNARLRRLSIEDADNESFSATFRGHVSNFAHKDSLKYELTEGNIAVKGIELSPLLKTWLPDGATAKIRLIKTLNLHITGAGTLAKGHVELNSAGTPGKINANASYAYHGTSFSTKGNATVSALNIGMLTGDARLGLVDLTANGNISLSGRKVTESVADIGIQRFDFNGYSFTGTCIALDINKNKNAEINISVNDPAAQFHAYGFYNYETDNSLEATASFSNIDLAKMNISDKYAGKKLSGRILANVSSFNPSDLRAELGLLDIAWTDDKNEGLKISKLNISATADSTENIISIDSPYLTGNLRGHYNMRAVVPDIKKIVGHFVPALEWNKEEDTTDKAIEQNNFTFDLDIKPTEDICKFFTIPVSVAYDGNIRGHLNSIEGAAGINIDLPYISNGNKLIEKTTASAELDINNERSLISAHTQMPTKKGDMNLTTTITAANNKIDTQVEWGLDRLKPVNGTIDISATIHRVVKKDNSLLPLEATVEFLPGTLNFGEDTWAIERSKIYLMPERIDISDFALDTGRQRIEIDGTASKDPDESLHIALNDIRLVHIFETLDIDNVLIDGLATGNISAKSIFSGEPILECPALHVDSIGYNSCYFGNADVSAKWDTEKRAIHLDAGIDGFTGKKSYIYGDILPLNEALDLNFDVDSVPVGFLKPFMATFTSDISGNATGKCRLFGTFHDIDLEGTVFADNVKIKVDFTNVSYAATDTIRITPGHIKLDNITIHDPEGHTANLNGFVNHTYFRAPVFRFDISDARNLLSYNTTSRNNPDWYGTIYGNGSASISGLPGVVNIDADMSTGPRSTFTFVLSDRLDAEDYSFLSFHDVTPDSLRAPVIDNDPTPAVIRQMKQKFDNAADAQGSEYNMNLKIAATPNANMTLVVDPLSGDEIKATGLGNLGLEYRSADNDLKIWGKYIVNEGKYRFTLQDIIIKDFTIKEGSEIGFNGDPYSIRTSLSAYYATNANLTDLDESFQQDKEIARTNVPVHAIMNVSGDIRQPTIDFDFSFPTLSSDTYRKVRSIVSTPDMMNRQIIYLLALNRFYTPDYMNTTKGNELFSVASSTISSQLGNMLGKLSDNWSIAPNLRSDRGDFSDVEVDVALSSRLLNNRLLFNGNFGYRDKALNNDQFIGDFDIEYLLNKSGTWRLKAYNRYNDRNYYVRSALTTQGVGVVFRLDFDKPGNLLDPFSFLRRKKEEDKTKQK